MGNQSPGGLEAKGRAASKCRSGQRKTARREEVYHLQTLPLTSRRKTVPENTILCDPKCLFPTGSNRSDNMSPTDLPGLQRINEVKDGEHSWKPGRPEDQRCWGHAGAPPPTQGCFLTGPWGRPRAVHTISFWS